MSLTLSQLLAAPTVDNVRSMAVQFFQGLGIVVESGLGGGSSPLGTGSLILSGSPIAQYPKVVVNIVGSGELGTATFQYSLDGGITFTGVLTVPASGVYVLALTGATITFTPGPSGAGTSFVVGDGFSFALNTPSLPVTSWPTSGGLRLLMEFQSQALAKISAQVAALAAGGYTPLATGSWCDLIGFGFYGLQRLGTGTLAGITNGVILLTDSAGAGPFVIAANAMGSSSTGGLLYFNTNGGTLPKGGTLQLTVTAQSPGSKYNVANGTIQTISSGILPGVTVNNPDPGTGSWITVQGTDAESDSAYMLRCSQRWSALGTGSPASAYQLWTTLAEAAAGHTTTVSKSLVQADTSVPGQIDIYIAGSSGAVNTQAVTDATAYILQRQALTANVVVQSATNRVITVAGTVNYYLAKTTSVIAQAAVQSALSAYISSLGIGNGLASTSTVYYSEIQAAIGAVLGGAGISIRNVAGLLVNGGTTDITLTLGQVATLTNSLTFVGV